MEFSRLFNLQRALYLVVGAIMLSACNGSDDDEDYRQAQSELSSNKALWENKHLATYQYTYQRLCECEIDSQVSVQIDNAQISAAYFVSNSEALSDEQIVQLFTIEQVFDEIQSGIDKKAFKISVTYDSAMGYPQSVNIDFDEKMADEEFIVNISDLQ